VLLGHRWLNGNRPPSTREDHAGNSEKSGRISGSTRCTRVLAHLALDPRVERCVISSSLHVNELAVLTDRTTCPRQYREGLSSVDAGRVPSPRTAKGPRDSGAAVRRDGHHGSTTRGDRDFRPRFRDCHQDRPRGGLPAELAEARHRQVRTGVAQDPTGQWTPVGDDVGTPTIHVNGVAFFRPVLSKSRWRRSRQAVGRIGDFASYPHFWESQAQPPDRRRSTEVRDRASVVMTLYPMTPFASTWGSDHAGSNSTAHHRASP